MGADRFPMVALNLDHSVFSGGEIGAARPAALFQFRGEFLQKKLVFRKPVDHGDRLSAAPLFLDPKHGYELVALRIDHGLTGAFGDHFFALRAFPVQLRIGGINEPRVFGIHLVQTITQSGNPPEGTAIGSQAKPGFSHTSVRALQKQDN